MYNGNRKEMRYLFRARIENNLSLISGMCCTVRSSHHTDAFSTSQTRFDQKQAMKSNLE